MIIWTIEGLPNNGFYQKNGGIIKERKDFDLDEKIYPGVGYVFHMQ
ncbi:hypothetical protein K7I13_07035 [Brucepastera parasyntrophica]|nr:hypothetical protein [Brucepastera parasyntrophica]ULQ61000.1 hypothetical protein K7I13_07035 [Brucepastera parasyntrophica]